MGRAFRAKATTPVLFKDSQKQHVARLGDPVPSRSFQGCTLPWFSRERGNVLDPCWTLFLSLPCNKWPRSIRWQKEGKVVCTCGTWPLLHNQSCHFGLSFLDSTQNEGWCRSEATLRLVIKECKKLGPPTPDSILNCSWTRGWIL